MNDRREIQHRLKVIFVFILCALTALSGGYFLARDISGGEGGSRGIQMATLEHKESKVRRKSSSSFSWGSINEEEALYKKDSVHTGPGSTATIKMNEGELIEIGENSLVVIDRVDQLTMNPIKGSFVIRTKDGDRKVDVGADGKTRVVVIPVRLVSPEPYSATLVASHVIESDISFSWEMKDKANPSKESFKFEIARDKKFRTIVRSEEIKDLAQKKINLKLPIGNYFWRVSQGSAGLSESNAFRIAHAPVLSLAEPADKGKIALFDQDPLMQFRWSLPTDAVSLDDLSRTDATHFIEFSSTENFATVIKSKTIQATSGIASISDMPFGTMFWRIKSHYGKKSGEKSDFYTKVSRFTVEHAKALTLNLIKPLNNTTHDYISQFRFNWECDTPLNNIEYQFSLFAKDGHTVLMEKTASNYYVWKKPEAGQYSWQVKAILKDKVFGESGRNLFSVFTGAPLSLVLPEKNSNEYYWETAKVTAFEWKSDDIVKAQDAFYEVELTKDSSFKTVEAKVEKLKKNEITSSQFKVVGGEYFWRVKVVDSAGTLIKVSESRRILLGLHPKLAGPVGIHPKATYTKNLMEDEKDLTFAWDSLKNVKSFEWSLIENKTGIKRSLANLSDDKLSGKTLLYKKTENEKITFTFDDIKNVPPGKYEWTVRAIDVLGRHGEWMSPREINFTAGEVLSAPAITSPEVQ